MEDKSQSWHITSVASMAMNLVVVGGLFIVSFGILAFLLRYSIGEETLQGVSAVGFVFIAWGMK